MADDKSVENNSNPLEGVKDNDGSKVVDKVNDDIIKKASLEAKNNIKKSIIDDLKTLKDDTKDVTMSDDDRLKLEAEIKAKVREELLAKEREEQLRAEREAERIQLNSLKEQIEKLKQVVEETKTVSTKQPVTMNNPFEGKDPKVSFEELVNDPVKYKELQRNSMKAFLEARGR